MPRVKTTTSKKSKKLVSNKRFNLSRGQLIAICLVLGIAGVVVVVKSFAGTNVGVYAYNSTNYYGAPSSKPVRPPVIGHHGGGKITLTMQPFGGSPKVTNRTMWASLKGDHYMWFGPRVEIAGNKTKITKILHTCWTYVAPERTDAEVILDVTTNSGQRTLWSEKKVIKHEQPLIAIEPSGRTHLEYDMHQYCFADDAIHVPASGFKDLEIRAKVTKSGQYNGDTFNLWKTSWQVMPLPVYHV